MNFRQLLLSGLPVCPRGGYQPGSQIRGSGGGLRAAVAAPDLRDHGVDAVRVSVGVAVQAAPDQPIAELIEEADRALYRAKEAGRDRVVAA